MITTRCPVCREELAHRRLKEDTEVLVQCTGCGYTHRVPKAVQPGLLAIRTIVSREAESEVCSVEMLPDDICAMGDLIVAECGDEAVAVEITGIESGDRRVERARASEVTTLWTRAIEQVIVKASVHAGRLTVPLYQVAEGEREFAVGETCTFGGRRIRISGIKLREGQMMRKEGWKAMARKIKRIYGYFL